MARICTKTRDRVYILRNHRILILIFVLALAIISLSVSAIETTVTIQNASIEPGEITVVPIMINDVMNVSGAHVLLTYNSSVVQVNSIDSTSFGLETFKEINNSSGFTRYAVINILGALEGPDIKLADVEIEAVGNPGDSCILELDVISMQDDTYSEISRTVINGTFTITFTGTPTISIYLDDYVYVEGEAMNLGLDIKNPTPDLDSCVVVWLEKTGGSIIFVPLHVHSVTLPCGFDYSNPNLMEFTLPNLPTGFYTWHAALLDPSTHSIIVEDSYGWTFIGSS